MRHTFKSKEIQMAENTNISTYRVEPAPRELYEPIFGPEAPLHQQMMAWSKNASGAVMPFMAAIYTGGSLDPRLVELLRIRIAFHNQCRTCMATRNQDVGITEDVVCSLEKPEEAPDLTDAERAALHFADLFATDHFSVKDETFERLHEYFRNEEIVDLMVLIGGTLGMGRMTALFDIVDGLPERFQQGRDAKNITPWGDGDVLVNSPDMSGKLLRKPGLQRV
jgi:alkylhydroperoxidase family enzyme